MSRIFLLRQELVILTIYENYLQSVECKQRVETLKFDLGVRFDVQV